MGSNERLTPRCTPATDDGSARRRPDNGGRDWRGGMLGGAARRTRRPNRSRHVRFGRKRLERRRRRHACAPCERLTAGCTSSPGRSVGREKRMAVAARLEISRADREPRLRANGGPCGSRAANRARQAHGAVQMPRLWASPEVSPLIPGRERADVAAVGPRQATAEPLSCGFNLISSFLGGRRTAQVRAVPAPTALLH